MNKYRVTEDLRYRPDGKVIIPKGAIVVNADDFPFYGIKRIDTPFEGYDESDFDTYGMEIHMQDLKGEKLPWEDKLEEIV